MKKLDDLIDVFAKLPGIGRKSAQRIAFDILEKSENEIDEMLNTIKTSHSGIKHCKICGNLSENDICEICSDDKRDKNVICVVEGVRDVIAFEKSDTYFGLYHVLGGKIDPQKGKNKKVSKIASGIPIGGNIEYTDILTLGKSLEGRIDIE